MKRFSIAWQESHLRLRSNMYSCLKYAYKTMGIRKTYTQSVVDAFLQECKRITDARKLNAKLAIAVERLKKA